MSRKAAFKQSDVTRLVKGAVAAGLPVGSFKIAVENGRLTLLPTEPSDALPSANDAEDAWDRALGLQ
jgi:hypothetical protein